MHLVAVSQSRSVKKKIQEQPTASVEELVNQVQKEFSEDKITTQQRPSALDKATTSIIKNHVKYDSDEDLSVSYNPTTKIFSNKSRTIGFQKYEDADKYNKLIGAKADDKPIAKPAAQKPFYKKGEAKIVIKELERQKKNKNFVLKTEPVKFDTTPIPTLADAAEVDPKLKELEQKFNKILKEREFSKTRGIANLFGVKTDDV